MSTEIEKFIRSERKRRERLNRQVESVALQSELEWLNKLNHMVENMIANDNLTELLYSIKNKKRRQGG